MKQPDLQLQSPKFALDPKATEQMAALVAKMQEIFRDVYDNLHTLPVVTAAPVATEMEEVGREPGKVKSDIKVLHDATQTNRKVYYKYQGTVYPIDSA